MDGCTVPSTLEGVRATLMRQAGAAQLLCHDDASKPVFSHLPQSPDGYGGFHDRAGAFLCTAGASFAPGDVWTLFYFNRVNFHPAMKTFMQHFLPLARFEPQDTSTTSSSSSSSSSTSTTTTTTTTTTSSPIVQLTPHPGQPISIWEIGASSYRKCFVGQANCQTTATQLPREHGREQI